MKNKVMFSFTYILISYAYQNEAKQLLYEIMLQFLVAKEEEESELEPQETEEECKRCLEVAANQLNISVNDFTKVGEEVILYFNEPKQLLSIFTDLEDENLRLIEKCQEAEDKLDEVKKANRDTQERLNQQSGKFEKVKI